eukprot:CAMPEP_0185793010 /NCGR_PEP_ID=MMETSP1174-20130828/159240_1 /TAXON_ID=35687 /ORGANISM="Dictyocha speculum, Strain CCMP1381" /LENGTH=41 /DNA_ID= /DNA_START= /DNA_END= /DNA_ORIENTATION=
MKSLCKGREVSLEKSQGHVIAREYDACYWPPSNEGVAETSV